MAKLPPAVLSFLVLLGGCTAHPAVIHPRFQELCPEKIVVMPVKNRTLDDLEAVSLAGLLQRWTLGGDTINVLELLASSLRVSLEQKGYQIESGTETRVSGEGAELVPGSLAVLLSEITSWKTTAVGTGRSISFSGNLKLVLGDEVLFEDSFRYHSNKSDGYLLTAQDLQHDIRRAGRRLSRQLPSYQTDTDDGNASAVSTQSSDSATGQQS